MKKLYLALAIFAGLLGPVLAQGGPDPGTAVSGTAINRSTLNASVVITTGNTFQTVITSVAGTTKQRQALTIENNNSTDSCWVFVGSGTASTGKSILLLAGGAYTRYWPFVPSDTIQATCASSSDTLYVEIQ